MTQLISTIKQPSPVRLTRSVCRAGGFVLVACSENRRKPFVFVVGSPRASLIFMGGGALKAHEVLSESYTGLVLQPMCSDPQAWAGKIVCFCHTEIRQIRPRAVTELRTHPRRDFCPLLHRFEDISGPCVCRS